MEAVARGAMTAANIEKGYAMLDAAWGAWAADHATFPHFSGAVGPGGGGAEGAAAREAEDKAILAEMKAEAARWKEHLALEANECGDAGGRGKGGTTSQLVTVASGDGRIQAAALAQLRGP